MDRRSRDPGARGCIEQEDPLGYCIDIQESDVKIAAEHLPKIFDRIKKIKLDRSHYGWEQQDEIDNATTVEEACSALFFDLRKTEAGDIVNVYFLGEKGSDGQPLFYDAIAPYVTAGSYIEWAGEDHHRWRIRFDGISWSEQYAHVSWA